MKTQRGFVSAAFLIAIVLGLIVVGGGAYYVMHQQSPSPTLSDNTLDNSQTLPTTNTQATTNTTAQPAPVQNNSTPNGIKVSATIDPSSLFSNSGNPTIRGAATGLSKITVSVSSLDTKCGVGDYYVNSDVSVVNGEWSAFVSW